MLIGKKKGKLSDQQAVYKKRNAPRYALKAGITIEGFEGEGMLENISNTGCCMNSSTFVSITPDEVYQVTIIPGQGESIKAFSQKLRATWTKSSELMFQAGFSMADGQGKAAMEQYVELLKSQGAHPDYGNMDKDKSI